MRLYKGYIRVYRVLGLGGLVRVWGFRGVGILWGWGFRVYWFRGLGDLGLVI